MAFVIVAASSATTNGATSVVCTRPTGTAVGHFILTLVAVHGNGTTIAAPSGWTASATRTQNNGGGSVTSTYYRFAQAGDSTTTTWTFSASVAATVIQLTISGVDTSSPIVTSSVNSSASSNVNVNGSSITPSVANTLLLFLGSAKSTAAWTAPSGMTGRGNAATSAGSNNITSYIASQDWPTASTATGTKTATLSGAAYWSAIMLALRPSAGSSPGAWKWTRAFRDLIYRHKRTTLAGTSNIEGYLRVSTDGTTWRYFAGPLGSDGRTLTEVANQSAAQSAAVAVPTNDTWDLPAMIEARYVDLYHRAIDNASYTIGEFYPRRLVQADDIEAESIRGIHIRADAIDGKVITGATIRSSASGPRWEGDGTRLFGTDGTDTQWEVTNADGAIWFGGGIGRLARNGLSFLARSEVPSVAAVVPAAVNWQTATNVLCALIEGYDNGKLLFQSTGQQIHRAPSVSFEGPSATATSVDVLGSLTASTHVNFDYGAGTANPGAPLPLAGVQGYRSDLGWRVNGNNTGYVTQHEYVQVVSALTTANATSPQSTPSVPVRADYAIQVHRVVIHYRVATTNNGSNYWTIALQGLDAAETTSTTIHSISTASATAGTKTKADAPPTIASPTYREAVRLFAQKTGSPGALEISATVYYKLIVP